MKTMLPLSNTTESSIISSLGEKYVMSLRKRNKFFYTTQEEKNGDLERREKKRKKNGNVTDAQQKAKHTRTTKPPWDCNYHCRACL